MRKFKDTLTGATLETDNEFVIAQYEKHTDRYQEVKAGKPKADKESEK